jgi:hypothetical protein
MQAVVIMYYRLTATSSNRNISSSVLFKKKIICTKSWLPLWSGHAAVPGLPVIGNLHQLKEKKPQQAFTKWAEDYGPIYSIKTGASSAFVLNSTEVAKEVS